MKYEGIYFNVKIDKYPTLEYFKNRFKHIWKDDKNRERKLEEVYSLLKMKG